MSLGRLVVALFLAAAVLWALAATARAADEHVYDPGLSLTGGTGTTILDPVSDPGAAHPKKAFNDPCGVATDAYGNVYVANGAADAHHIDEGKTVYDSVIAVFGPGGEFISEVPNDHWACSIAVDSFGRLYAYENGTNHVVRYDPLVYEPSSGKIEYDPTTTLVATAEPGTPFLLGMGLDPSEDHLYVSYAESEAKFLFEELLPDGTVVNSFSEDVFGDPTSLAVWGQSHDIYSSGSPRTPLYEPEEARVYTMDASTHEVKLTLDGSNTPDGNFGFTSGRGGIAVDQANGDIYVDAVKVHHAVDQFDVEGNFVGRLALEGNGLKAAEPFSGIAIDQGEHSPNQGYVYVTSGFNAANSHLYAFAPRDVKPPEVRGAHLEEAGETEALLTAEVNPHGAATTYRFEYGPADCSASPCQSAPLPEGEAGAGGSFRPVIASLTGLVPGATYHFRIVATNHCSPVDSAEQCVAAGPDGTFATFSPIPAAECPNASLRVGPSVGLADCRAYELVSPPDTNGRIPTGTVFGTGVAGSPPVLLSAADGESVVFGTEGGTLPDSGGGGFYDTFVSRRGPGGWQTEFSGLPGTVAEKPYAGGVSADHSYALWQVEKGSLAVGHYLRGPGGRLETVGVGSLGSAAAQSRWISPGAAHLIFTAGAPLEPNAPPSGTSAVYDRSPGGPTHVVSLLPGEVTPAAGQAADYLGAAAQGSTVVFRLGGALYARIGNAETVKVVDDPATFGGIAGDGSRVFYVKGGDVFAFETADRATAAVGAGGESTMVNVSADGSHVYFVSPLVLTGAEANSQGAKPLAGAENLYAWEASSETVRFVATVEEEDVVGEESPPGGSSGSIGGLGLWVSDAVNPAQDRFLGPANDPSRTSPDGRVLVFESRAKLTDYDNGGHSEVYRYDAAGAELGCVSCNPTGAPAASEARLESRYAILLFSIPPVNAVSQITNVAAGGDRVFFQSADRLAPGDRDGKIDVYEWQAHGTKACGFAAGCIRLISGGRSAGDDYLYGASANGASVFFLSADTLLEEDPDSTPSIYVAREDGGFPHTSGPLAECLGEACQAPVTAPDDPTPASSAFVGPGNPGLGAKRCPKGKRKVRGKHGEHRCAGRHARHRRAHRGGRPAR